MVSLRDPSELCRAQVEHFLEPSLENASTAVSQVSGNFLDRMGRRFQSLSCRPQPPPLRVLTHTQPYLALEQSRSVRTGNPQAELSTDLV